MRFFDTYAIIETINGNLSYEKYKEEVFITNTLHLSEFVYSLLRNLSEELTEKILKILNFQFIEISEEIAVEAAKFKYKHKTKNFSYADCIGYITALKNDLLFLTGDKEFRNLKNVEFISK